MSLQKENIQNKEDNLLKRFEEIHDYIYSNDGLSPQQTLEEFVKLLFIKVFDETGNLNQFTITQNEWADLKVGKNAYSLLKRIDSLFELTKQNYKDIFDKDDRVRISSISMGFTVNKLQNISLLNSSQDAKGLAFQKLLSHHEKEGQGQFFTPEPIIDFCVEMMQPKATEFIIDPACGSGGFLISSLRYIQKKYPKVNTKKIVSEHLFGLDINKSIARIAKMKLLLESNGKTNIQCLNSLEDLDSIKLLISRKDGFDMVLANPPFGAKITNSSTLASFDLGYRWEGENNNYKKTKTVYPSQNAEILYIERCLHFLKEGGRMAIVLPNGNFENPSLDYLRYFIKLKAKLLAIVNLPQETFIPYGTGVKTSLLFLEKDTPNKIRNYPIFFGRVKKLGYQGNKNGSPMYKKDTQGNLIKDTLGSLIIDEDFSEIASDYNAYLNGKSIDKENSFSINYDELNGRFDYDFYSPENRKMITNFVKKKTVRLGDICQIVKEKSSKLKESNLTVEYVELSDINTHAFEIIKSTTHQVYELPSRASYEIQKGDIITAIAGNSVGSRKHATALVSSDFEGSICTNGFRVLRDFKIDSYYFLYFLKSDFFLKQMYMYRTGAAIPNVSTKDLSNIIINLPSKKIIEEIANRMKKSFDLRQESQLVLEGINDLIN